MAAFDSGVQGGAPLAEQRYRYLRELSGRSLPTFAALMPWLVDGRPGSALVVVERVFRGSISDEHAAELVAEARRVATLQHPNLVRIRDLAACEDDFVVACEYVDGERLSELRGAKPVAVAARILVDVLTGLGALHGLRDANNQPLKLAHGEVAASNILVGTDGGGRLLRACRIRLPGGTARARGDLGYFAPEVLTGGLPDSRSDVYSAGVLLWEALSGSPPFGPADDSAEIVARVMSGRVPPPRGSQDEPWAEPLAEVAARAMSALPDARYATASAMAADIRRIAGPKLASSGRVSAFLKGIAGDRIAERRAQLERTPAPPAAGASPGLLWPGARSPVAAAAPKKPPPPKPVVAKPPLPKPMSLPSHTPTIRPGRAPEPAAASRPAPIPLVPPVQAEAPSEPATPRRGLEPPPSASDVLSALELRLNLPDLDSSDSEPTTIRRPEHASDPTPLDLVHKVERRDHEKPPEPISAIEIDVEPDSVRDAPAPPPMPRRPPPAPPVRPTRPPRPVPHVEPVFSTALPPMRALEMTEPSLHAQGRGRKRRAIVISVFGVGVAVIAVAAWRFTQKTEDAGSAGSSSPVRAETAAKSVVRETSTVPSVTTGTEPPVVATSAPPVAVTETTSPTATTASAAPQSTLVAPPPVTTTAPPPATTTAPPPATTTAPPPATTTAPPPATTTAPPPATTKAPPPAKPPTKPFDPTVI